MRNFVRGTDEGISGFYISNLWKCPENNSLSTCQSHPLVWSSEMITNGSPPYWKLIMVIIIITQFSRNINFSWSKCNPSISIYYHTTRKWASLSSLVVMTRYLCYVNVTLLLYNIHFCCRKLFKSKKKKKQCKGWERQLLLKVYLWSDYLT